MTATPTPTDERVQALPDAGPDRPWGPPVVVASVLGMLLAALVGGASPHEAVEGVPDAGPAVGWGLLVARLVAEGAALATVGLLLLGAVLLPNREGRLIGSGFQGVRLAALPAGLWAAASFVQFLLTSADVLARPVHEVLAPEVLRASVDLLPQARALLIQAGLAALVAVVARLTLHAGLALALLAGSLVAIAPPLLEGHAAAAGDHMLAVSSVVIHVVALALWVGGLGALLWVRRRSPQSTALHIAATRFSTLALWCAVLVGLSGVVNAALRLQSVSALLSTGYGGLVALKAAAFFALVAAGAAHRSRTLPQFPSDRRAFARLAAGELLLMAATVGLAVALGRTPTPVPLDEGVDGAVDLEILRSVLGFDPPPPPSAWNYLVQVQVDGFFLTFVGVAAVLYVQGVLALRRRGDRWPVGRTVSWFGGLAVVLYATCGGLGAYSHILFSAHMFAHMLLSMLAPILLVLGAPTTLALRTLPAGSQVAADRGPRQALLGVLHSRPVAVLTHPVVAGVIFVGSLFGLYFTPLLDWLMNSHLGHSAMAAHFLAVGSLFFYVLVGIDPSPRPLPHLARVGLLFVVMPFHAFFSVILMGTDEVLAPTYYQRVGDPYSVGLLEDQHLGGSIGWAMGEAPMVLVLIAVFIAWIRADEREARRRDRASDRAVARGEEDELAAYNAWLADLDKRSRG